MNTCFQKLTAVLLLIALVMTGIPTPAWSDEAAREPMAAAYRAAEQINGALDPDSGLLYVEKEDHIEVKQYAGFSSTVVVPREIAGKPVTSVTLEGCGTGAWGNFFQGIVKVVLPDTIVRLDDEAFYALSFLREVEGLEYVRELGRFPFEQCGLEEAHFSRRLRKVDQHGFSDSILKHVTIPDDIEIGHQQFFFDDGLESLTLLRGTGTATLKLEGKLLISPDGKSLRRVLPNYQAASLVIPDGVETIEHDALFGLRMVQDYTFPDSIREIVNVNFYPHRTILRARKGSYAWNYFSENLPAECELRDLGTESLADMARKVVRKVVKKGMSEWDKAFALHNWVLKQTAYDESLTHFDAESVFTEGIGVCDAYARAYSALLNEAGIENRYIACWMQNEGHAINAVKIDGAWCYVDCTNDDAGTVGAPYYLFGFNDTLYREVYSGGTGLTASATAAYAPFRKGDLKDMEQQLSKEISSALCKGQKTFDIDAAPSVGRFPAFMLADRMQEKTWTVDGKKRKIICRFINEFQTDSRHYSISLVLPKTESFNYTETSDGQGICLTEYLGASEEVTVPDTLDGHQVLALEGTFTDRKQIRKVVLPKSVREIGDNTFSGCTCLQSVNFPAGLKRIGKQAFYRCTALQSDAVLPNGLEEIGDAAFFSCMNLSGALIPGTVQKLGIEVFAECSNLSRVTLCSGVRSVPDGMFVSCLHLSGVKLPSTLKSIGMGAFTLSGINSLEIPSSVTSIDPSAFMGAKFLKKLSVSKKNPKYSSAKNMLLSKNGKVLLAGTRGVDPDLVIPAGVEEIGEQAFVFIPLRSITIPKGVRKIGYKAFAGDNTYTSVTMADTVEEIGSFAFGAWETVGIMYFASTCEFNQLRSIRLSKGLKKIGEYAFAGTRLKKLILPDSLTALDCTIITQPMALYIPDSIKSIAEQNILYGSDGFVIHGSKGSAAEKYAKAHGLPFVSEARNLSFNADLMVLLPAERFKPSLHLGDGTAVPPAEAAWTVDGDCVKVSKGTFIAQGPGKATVTASWNGYEGSCEVYVANPDRYWFLGDHYGVDKDGVLLYPNHKYLLDFEVVVEELNYSVISMKDHVQWSVSDPKILRLITPGTLEVVGAGEASFSVTLPDGRVYSLQVETVAGGPTPQPGPEITPVPLQDTVTVSGGKYKLNHKKKTAVLAGPAKSSTAKITIPDQVEANGITYTVTEIAADACKGKNLKTVFIGARVKTIGANAFKGCKKLSAVTGGDGLVTIGSSAFEGCSALKAFTLKAKVKTIGAGAFKDCKKLKEIIIKTVKLAGGTVGAKAFATGAAATYKCPKSKLKAYQKLLLSKGAHKKSKFE